jgi:Ni,Fe-hydrogenase III small subunit/Pyruvate/2-oxoacid:ferredoxin oxidoreductase delta subunit
MSIWTLIGLAKGQATTKWPKKGDNHGQAGLVGMPRYNPDVCESGCSLCADVCLPEAITRTDKQGELNIDYGKCVNCQMCVDACPTDAMTASDDWAFGVKHRDDLVWSSKTGSVAQTKENRAGFKRSLHIRHVDAGSCNGCESELSALDNPFYNLDRLGVFFTPSPRFADLLLVTGPVTYNMHEPLLAAYQAMPEPRWVMAVGTCAVSGGTNGGGYACHHGLEGILPVDLYLPGCPPNPAAIISAFMTFLNRMPQKVQGGKVVSD